MMMMMATSKQWFGAFPTTPLLDRSGNLDAGWRFFFLQLFNRTGGGQGINAAVGRDPSTAVTPGPSPFAYTAASNGTLFVAGGGVVAMTVNRGGGVLAPVGHFYGGIRLVEGDVLMTSYVQAPAMNFFPG